MKKKFKLGQFKIKTGILLIKIAKKLFSFYKNIEKKIGSGTIYIATLLAFLGTTLFIVTVDFDANIRDTISPEESKTKDDNDIKVINFHTDYFSNSNNKWRMKARKAKIYQNKNEIVLFSIHLDYFDKKKITNTIKAENSLIKSKEKKVILTGNVIMKNKKGSMILGENFLYDDNTKKITSDDFVTIINPDGSEVSGKGFSSTADLENITFNSSVRGKILSKKDTNSFKE